ncbi:MAG: pyridoxamine 5'-phosphate oxidase family protein [Candidatus Cyclobacteriaceae bacterium M2_1C_046]
MENPINNRNKVKRIPKRGHYDQETLYNILDAGFVCHVGFIQNNQPFVIPTLYGRIDDKLYIHGASTSRMLKELEKGLDVCLTVTHVDALVLARSAFHHSMNYRSAMVFGKAYIAEEPEKSQALKAISDNIIAGRWEEVREPSAKELKATTVLRLEIEQVSSKVRTGPPGDDEPDYELPIWAGLLNFETSVKEIITDPLLKKEMEISPSVKGFKPKNNPH